MVFCKQRFPSCLYLSLQKWHSYASQYAFPHLFLFLAPVRLEMVLREKDRMKKFSKKNIKQKKNRIKNKKYRKQWRKHGLFHSSTTLMKKFVLKKEKGGGRKNKFCCKVLAMIFENMFSHHCLLGSPPLLFSFLVRQNRLSYKLQM